VANCAVCREDIQPGTTCPRCGTQDQGQSDLTFGYFASIWAILSFLLILAPLFMLLPMVLGWLESIFQPIASVRVGAPVSLLVTMVIAFFLFSMRDDLHRQDQARTFQKEQRSSLPMRALQFFVLGVVLTFVLAFAITSKDMLIGPGPGQVPFDSFGHLLLKLAMTGSLVLLFATFALASGYMAVYEFGLYYEERTPDPIYLNQRLMLKVVLKAVQRHIGNIGRSVDRLDDLAVAADDAKIELFLIKMERTADAGMTLLLHHKGRIPAEFQDKDEPLLEEKRWLAEADLWARLTKMIEEGPRTVKVGKSEEKPEKEPEPAKELVPAEKQAA
jgi:hypothetical protein